MFQKLWGRGAYFISHTSDSRGIAGLRRDDLEVDDVEFENIITFNLSRHEFTFMDVYALNEDLSNDDTKRFFIEVFDDFYYQDYHHIMYTGDF